MRTAFRVRSQIQSLCDGTQMIKKKANGKPEKQNKTEGFYARHRNICVTITMIKRKENVKGLRGIHIIL